MLSPTIFSLLLIESAHIWAYEQEGLTVTGKEVIFQFPAYLLLYS